MLLYVESNLQSNGAECAWKDSRAGADCAVQFMSEYELLGVSTN
jgi:hypothetical protein